jgi:cobalamin biosynthesis protein CobD/CbiB
MSAMAGALKIQLEKPGYYTLGKPIQELSQKHIYQALQIMYLSTLLFILLTLSLTILTTVLLQNL